MAAGAFSSVAQKRAHELAATRAASLDHGACAKVSPLAPNSQSQEAIAQAAVTTLINAKTRTTPPLKYFRPANSEICFGKMRFVLTDRPTNRNIDAYIGELERFRTSNLVRVCEPTYDKTPLTMRGIEVDDWEFEDGKSPPLELTQKWLKLCADQFTRSDHAIAVHDVAGLGRAPLLVGIALLEAGMKCEDVVFLIRSKRRGALNETQLEYLRQYKAAGALRSFRYIEAEKERHKSCLIM